VALFVDRARAVQPGVASTEGNAAAVAEICRRLEGLPLAIELARTRLLDPAVLLDRLAASLDALGTGAVDLPERQRTLRATVEWSVGLLADAERSLLEVTAVFVDGWTIRTPPRWRAWPRPRSASGWARASSIMRSPPALRSPSARR
jgi:predicted ATPase